MLAKVTFRKGSFLSSPTGSKMKPSADLKCVKVVKDEC